MLAMMDGNQFLNLVNSQFWGGFAHLNSYQSRSDFFIPPEEVDIFKNEVEQSKKVSHLVFCLCLINF